MKNISVKLAPFFFDTSFSQIANYMQLYKL